MNGWITDCERKNPTIEIGLIESRWHQAKNAVKDAEYIEKLVFRDYVGTIRSFKSVWDYRVPMIKAAQEQIGEKYKKNRQDFEYIQSTIRETFLCNNKSFKITDIIRGGYEGYYWQFYMTNNKEEFVIQIPIREQLDTNNIQHAHYGKFVFMFRENGYILRVLFDCYDEEKLAEYLREYFKLEDKTYEDKNG